MNHRIWRVSFLIAGLSLAGNGVLASDQPEPIYGSQLMTQQERNEYRARLRAAQTPQQREEIRHEHHERMRERAKAQGQRLPDDPPARGAGMGAGGGGMGPGGGRGR